MSTADFAEASIARKQIVHDAETLLGRHIGSSVSFDHETDQWVVNLMVTRTLAIAEIEQLRALGEQYGIRLDWVDQLRAGRLAG